MTKWKLPAALFAAALAVLGVAVAGGTAATAQAQTATAAASAAPGGSWSTAIPVPGLSTITDLTCTSPGNCVVVGPGSAGGSDVATERNGAWHTAQRFTLGKTVGAIETVDAVACSSQGNCVAGGSAGRGKGNDVPVGWGVVEKNGTWGSARPISGITTVAAISCVPNGGCTAVGREEPDPGGVPPVSAGMVVTESGGTWAKPHTIPKPAAVSSWWYFTLNSVSCTANGDCSAGGSIYNGGSGGYQETVSVLVTETNGVWAAATLVPGLPTSSLDNNYMTGLSCQAPGDCTATGQYSVTTIPGWTSVSGSFVSTETGGTWQPAVVIPASDGGYSVTSLSCLSIGHCVIAGSAVSNGDPVAADVVNGSVAGNPAVLPGSAGLHMSGCRSGLMSCLSSALVSCVPTGYCGVFGWYVVSGQSRATVFVDAKTAAGWQPIQAVRGLLPESSISAISCTATGYCTAAGSYSYSTAQGIRSQAFAVDEATASATLLKVSTPKITYGHERTERLTVDVTPHCACALTGTVTIKAGRTTLAALTLKSGKAGYTLTAKQFKVGSYALTATYSASATYLASTSPAVKVKVVK